MRTVTGAHRGEKALVTANLMTNTTGHSGAPADAPVPTLTTGQQQALVAASIARICQTGGGMQVAPADAPLSTIVSKQEHLLVGANLVGVGGRAGQSRPRSADEPLATLTAKADTAVVAPVLIGAGGPSYSGKPVSAGAPFGSLTTENHRALIAPTLIQTGYGERDGQAPRTLDIEKPIGTLVGSQKHALVAGFLNKHYTGVVGAPLTDPVPTITASDHNSLTTSNLVKLKGTAKDGQATDTPLHTVQAGGTHYAEVRAFLSAYYGTEQDTPMTDPMHTITTKDRYALVTVAGQEYFIADIGMRMLQPPELYAAQSFPPGYKINITYKGKPLPKSSQVRMCGNSVCPVLAEAMVRANYQIAELEKAA
jgi:DNA (cytosine-5)-methyltransferase 1